MKLVKFILSNAPYREGEIAGFDDKMADLLVSRKVAIAVAAPDTQNTPVEPVEDVKESKEEEKRPIRERAQLKDVIAERDGNSGYITK
jgi:hypothetical protein